MGRPAQYICRTCKSVALGQRSLRRQRPDAVRLLRGFDVSTRTFSTNLLKPTKQLRHQPIAKLVSLASSRHASVSSTDGEGELRTLLQRGDTVQSPDASPPSKEQVEDLFRDCEATARKLVGDQGELPTDSKAGPSLSSALLDLEEDSAKSASRRSQQPLPASRKKAIKSLSRLVYQIMVHPPVFITPELLKSYVNIQCLLNRPQSFPEVFDLYAIKPIPQADTTPIKYKTPNPNRAQFAVPKSVADIALDAAIKIKDLPLALSIIETTYSTPAFQRSKVLRKALVPLTGLALSPFAAYTLAAKLASYQDTMDPQLATNLAFAGILAYIGFTATIGIVAITTANDQMDRVTWAVGTPLNMRWLREEERAAIDKVACAWGFKDRRKRGEEEGEEWDGLREWMGRRRMILDRPEHMEGMQ